MPESDNLAPVAPESNLGVVSATETPAEAAQSDQNKADQAPAPAPDGDKPAEVLTPEQAAKREGRRYERKLSNALRRAAEERARADLYERQLAEAKQRPPEVTTDPNAPRLEQFSDIEEFRKAVEKHARESERKESETKRQSETQRQQLQHLTSAWEKKADAGNEKYEDFAEKVGDLKPNSPMLFAVMEADNGDDIAYYLATHLGEAESIARLSPTAQIRAIGRLEAKLAAEPSKPKTPSNAPAPIKPISGSSSSVGKKLIEMSQEEFEKKRRAQIAARR